MWQTNERFSISALHLGGTGLTKKEQKKKETSVMPMVASVSRFSYLDGHDLVRKAISEVTTKKGEREREVH